MSKLRSKLKVMQKRKSRREVVAKRKLERVQKEQEAKSAAAEERRIEAEVDEIIRKDAEGIVDDNTDDKMIAGLVVQRPALAAGKKKQMSRKQLKRQEKHRARGEATASAQDKKWNDKKLRVKHRAQVRNSELGNN